MGRRRTSFIASVAILGSMPVLLAGCVVPSPSPGKNAILNAVAAISSTNAYAAGSFVDGSGQHDFMEHWDGKAWQEVFLPPPFGTGLDAITAVSASNVWAVGEGRTLHFDGLSWRSLPNPAGIVMQNVASAPDGSVYGFGHNVGTNHGTNSTPNTLFQMTAGGWRSTSPLPAVGPRCSVTYATSLAVVKTNDVWTVANGTGNGNACAALLHWTGNRWQQSPPVSTGVAYMHAVSALSDNNVWAVGEQVTQSGQHDNSLVIHYNGARMGSVPTVDTHGSGVLLGIDVTPEAVWAVGRSPEGALAQDMLIKKFTGNRMVDQPVQRLPFTSSTTGYLAELYGVSVVDGVVTSVGTWAPSFGQAATLTDRRNAT